MILFDHSPITGVLPQGSMHVGECLLQMIVSIRMIMLKVTLRHITLLNLRYLLFAPIIAFYIS